MPQKSNNLDRFWKELKRRKVIHVITVYAALAFVILQVTNLVVQPLRLPEWTEAFVIFLLCIGFVISVFVSWVYDITPAGVQKTKSTSTIKHIDQETSLTSSGWKIATYISAVIIITLIAFNFINKRNLNIDISKLEKSIAVLPFFNDSPSDSNQYFINGIMEEVLNNLQKIKDFRVLSRNSVEQFRNNTTKSTPEIAKVLGVSFIVEGSGQKYGNRFVLRVQLIATNNEKHLWAESYNKEILETGDIIGIQSEIAQSIVKELNAAISPEEKKLIENTPTTNLNAYDYFFQAKNELMKFLMDNSNVDGLDKAMALYRQSLQYDSTFAQAYSGLANVFMNKYYAQANLKTNFVDSMIIYANKALNYNDQLEEAFYVKGKYYNITGDYDKALKEYSEAIEINPNYSLAYWDRAGLGLLKTFDIINAFEDGFKSIEIEHGSLRPGMMRSLGYTFNNFGFPENARYYNEEALKLDNDSISYLNLLASLEEYQNDSESLELSEKVLKRDPSNLEALGRSLDCYERLGKYEDAYHIALNILQIWKEKGYSPQIGWEVIGLAYWKTGYLKEAKYYFNKQIDLCKKILKLDPNDDYSKMVLAMIYSVLGEKEKALQFLKTVNNLIYIRYNKGNISSLIYLYWLKYNPLLENLHSEPMFHKMVSDYENVYNITFKRFKTWLENKGMLK
jgi:TolB-like protein